MKVAAGTLLYRRGPGGLQVLLVHHSGGYNRRAPWSIPKGLVEKDEPLEAAARRETLEETGVRAGSLRSIGFVDYTKSRKRIYAFAGEAPPETAPRAASWEIGRAEFFDLDRAREIIHDDQRAFLDRLL
jgi:predicted NUDIX family NTP pyrophosphohydrolase